MKLIAALIVGAVLSTAACSQEQQKQPDPVRVELPAVSASEPAKPQKVCINVWNAKLGREVQQCKWIVIHKPHLPASSPK